MKEHDELVPVRALRGTDDHSSEKSVVVKNDNFCDPLQAVATLGQTPCYQPDSISILSLIRQENPLEIETLRRHHL